MDFETVTLWLSCGFCLYKPLTIVDRVLLLPSSVPDYETEDPSWPLINETVLLHLKVWLHGSLLGGPRTQAQQKSI